MGDRPWEISLAVGDPRDSDGTMRDELGAQLSPSSIGVALATGPGGEMLLIDGTTDPADPNAAILEARRWDPVTDRWESDPDRFEVDVRTSSDPALAFVERPTSEHVLGGWYMLVYRGPQEHWTAIWRRPPDVRLTDAQGRFSRLGDDYWAEWRDWWTALSEDPHRFVTLAVSPYEPGRVIGSFVWRGDREWPRGVTHHRSLDFHPYADGTSAGTLNDQDDAKAIRFGLCYSLRHSPDCNPPLRAIPWTPAPVEIIFPPGGTP